MLLMGAKPKLNEWDETSMSFDKSRLPSRHSTVGPERAPHRSYLYAMGLTEEEINRPIVGVATTWNEAAPCNISLARQAQPAKLGVQEGGGTALPWAIPA